MLKAVIFDLDDTLLWDEKSVSEAFKATCDFATDYYNIDPYQLEKNVRRHAERIYMNYETYEFTKKIGTGPFEAFWAEYDDDGEGFAELREIVPEYRKLSWQEGLKELDIEDVQLAEQLAHKFPEERKKHIYLYDETIEVLEKLKNNYKLLLLTNGSPNLQQLKLFLSPELEPYFDHIVISGDFGKGKPSIEIFNYALSLLEVEKYETVMIGDNPFTDILGAIKAGIDSIWINHHRKELEEITPTYEVNRLREILPIIKSLSKS